ncbi:MAG TPA: tetratricopeptide repeat protein [Candidatus Acidoferrales bacterium]|nr:tetratricopeptide repeat protein [Candidatus Acidoferrales bacterium]
MALPRKISLLASSEKPAVAFLAAACFLLVGTIVIFWPVRHFRFLYFDDDINIFLNPNLGGLDRFTVRWMLTDCQYMRRYIPFGWMGFSVIYSISGLKAGGYHLACILLHGINTVLVMAICGEIIKKFRSPPQGGWAVVSAAFAAAWWAWQPMRVETVAWASGFLYIQAIFFLLVSLYIYITPTGKKISRVRLGLSAACYLISISSYPLGLAYPAVLLVWEAGLLQHEKRRFGRESWAAFKRPFGTIVLSFGLSAAVVGAATLYASSHANSFWRPETTRNLSLNLAEKIGRAIYVWGYYLWKPWWPFHHLLVPDRLDLAAWREKDFPVCAVVLAGLSWFFATKASRRTGIWAAGASYLLLLIPMLGLFDVSYFTSDRYSYPGSLPMAIAIAAGLSSITNLGRKWMAGAILALYITGQVFIMRSELPCWQNSSTFFVSLLNSLPRSAKLKMHVYYIVANTLKIEGHYELARSICLQGLAEYPNAKELEDQKTAIASSAAEAAKITQKLGMSSLLPEAPRSHFWIATQKIQHTEWQEAADHLNAALSDVPDFYPARLELAEVLTMQGKTDEALSCYLRALATSNGHLSTAQRAHFLFMLASASAAKGEERLARVAFNKGEALRAER